MTPVTTREHVNVTGRVPTIGEAAARFLSIGYRPRLSPGALKGTANFSISSMNSKGVAKLRAQLSEPGWAFIHDTPIRKGGWHTVTVLVTL